MHRVAAFQIGNPFMGFVEMKADNAARLPRRAGHDVDAL